MGVVNTQFELDGGPSSSYSFSFDATGATALYIAIAFDSDTPQTFTSVEYNSVAATQIDNNEVGRVIYLYRLLAPATGTNTLLVDYNGTVGGVSISVLALDDVNQTVPETGTGSTGGTSTTITTPDINSTSGDTLYSFGYLNNSGISAITEGAGQTLVAEDGRTNGVSWISSKAGAGPVQSMSWTKNTQSHGVVAFSASPSGSPGREIVDIDGDNTVQAGQIDVEIATVGLDAAPLTQIATLGGEPITVNSWSEVMVNVSIPLHINLDWNSSNNQLSLTDDTGTVTLDNVTILSPAGWEDTTFNGIPPDPGTTESFYEYAQIDPVVGNFLMANNDRLAWESQPGLEVNTQTIPTVNPPATVSGDYKIWDESLGTWTPVSNFTITDGGMFGAPGTGEQGTNEALMDDFKSTTGSDTFNFTEAAVGYYRQVGSVTTRQFNESLRAAQEAVPFEGLGPSDRRNS